MADVVDAHVQAFCCIDDVRERDALLRDLCRGSPRPGLRSVCSALGSPRESRGIRPRGFRSRRPQKSASPRRERFLRHSPAHAGLPRGDASVDESVFQITREQFPQVGRTQFCQRQNDLRCEVEAVFVLNRLDIGWADDRLAQHHQKGGDCTGFRLSPSARITSPENDRGDRFSRSASASVAASVPIRLRAMNASFNWSRAIDGACRSARRSQGC